MAKKLTRKAVPKAKQVHPYHVRFGGRDRLGPERTFPNEADARNAIIKEFNSWRPWCVRYNTAGTSALDKAIKDLSNTMFHHDPARLECCFDEHTDTWLVAEFWTTR